MSQFESTGFISVNSDKYDTILFDDKCIVNYGESFEKVKDLNNKWVTYIQIIQKVDGQEEMKKNIYLHNIHYCSNRNVEFDILCSIFDKEKPINSIILKSEGFTAFYNEVNYGDFDDKKNFFAELFEKSDVIDIVINNYNYKVAFNNRIYINDFNISNSILDKYKITTEVEVKSNTNIIQIEEIVPIIYYFHDFLMFVTFNQYTSIDDVYLNYKDDESPINLSYNSDIEEKKQKIKYCIQFDDIKGYSKLFFEKCTQLIKHPANLYLFNSNKIYNFDIVKLSGCFEGAFRKYVKTSKNYLECIKMIRKEIHYDELIKKLNEHADRYNLNGNDDYDNCIKTFNDYGKSLKDQLSFIMEDFMNSMNYEKENIYDFGFLYNPLKLEKRIKDARNDICHGLEKNNIDWKGAMQDTVLLQALIYFIFFKYCFLFPDDKIKKILEKCYNDLKIKFHSMD